jgi:hypothetical protein
MKIKAAILLANLWAVAISEVLEVKHELSDLSGHRLPPLNTPTEPHINKYDPAVIADDAKWDKCTNRGGKLICAMRFSDKYAGTAMKHTCVPASAKGIWTGDLVCNYNHVSGGSLPTPQQQTAHMLIQSGSSRYAEVGMERRRYRGHILSV